MSDLHILLGFADMNRNFLYDIDRQRGVLVDFGLAEVSQETLSRFLWC